MFHKIWFGLLAAALLVALLWVGAPYLAGAYYLDQGSRSLAGENTQAALAGLETALRFEPDNVLAYRRLARAHLQLDEPELALLCVGSDN